jgi:hypothetical protein
LTPGEKVLVVSQHWIRAVLECFALERDYLAPGMNHCHGGAGPFDFDMDSALTDWVEHDKAPNAVIASHFARPDAPPDRTRPLCPYPQVAKYKGTGSTDEASNFVCSKP